MMVDFEPFFTHFLSPPFCDSEDVQPHTLSIRGQDRKTLEKNNRHKKQPKKGVSQRCTVLIDIQYHRQILPILPTGFQSYSGKDFIFNFCVRHHVVEELQKVTASTRTSSFKVQHIIHTVQKCEGNKYT